QGADRFPECIDCGFVGWCSALGLTLRLAVEAKSRFGKDPQKRFLDTPVPFHRVLRHIPATAPKASETLSRGPYFLGELSFHRRQAVLDGLIAGGIAYSAISDHSTGEPT